MIGSWDARITFLMKFSVDNFGIRECALFSRSLVNYMFKYYVVLDFEATCDELNAPSPQEVIEFPSVLVDASSLKVVDEFQEYVKPLHHPKLREFCTELTGITQNVVDPADLFPVVFQNHQKWLESHDLSLNEDISEATWAFVSCGDWDLGTMLPTQLNACDPPIQIVPQCYRRWINIKRPFSEQMNKRAWGMKGMLKDLKLTLDGRHHSGIDDCRNIAKIVMELCKKKQLQITCQTVSHPSLLQLSCL